MPVYIALDHNNLVEDVVLATSKELASVYWQGKGVSACHVKEVTEDSLFGHPTGLIPIVTTMTAELTNPRMMHNKSREYRIISEHHSK